MRSPFFLAALGFALLTQPAAAYDNRDLNQLRAQKRCIGCDLSNANLRDENLVGADIRWSDLSGADLERAQLSGANLIGSNLANANMLRTNLEGANLQGAVLQGTDLFSARLSESDLRWADLQHLDINRDLSRLDVRDAQLEGARFANRYRCGEHSRPGRCLPERR